MTRKAFRERLPYNSNLLASIKEVFDKKQDQDGFFYGDRCGQKCKDGTTSSCHLVEGTRIFACVLFVEPLEVKQRRRTCDTETGLKL